MFIPRSNIIEIGYANPGKFQGNYTGYYHKDKNGNYWSGKEHNNQSLILSINEPTGFSLFEENTTYDNLNPLKFPNDIITPDFIRPTSQEYDIGIFTRYILKPILSSKPNNFIEVKVNKFLNVLQNPLLASLYKPVGFVWKLTGPLYDEYQDNIRIEAGIIDTNKRSLEEAEKIIPGISSYIIDLTQFSIVYYS